MKDLVRRQLEIEELAIGLGQENYKRNTEKSRQRKDVQSLLPESLLIKKLTKDVADKMEEYIATHPRGSKDHHHVKRVFSMLDPVEIWSRSST